MRKCNCGADLEASSLNIEGKEVRLVLKCPRVGHQWEISYNERAANRIGWFLDSNCQYFYFGA